MDDTLFAAGLFFLSYAYTRLAPNNEKKENDAKMIMYMKAGCPFCTKVAVWVAAAGLSGSLYFCYLIEK
jgi:hypothetical protein